jgi:hypothetical protein
MDVGTQNFRKAELINYRIEAFRVRITAVRLTINDEEVYLLRTA